MGGIVIKRAFIIAKQQDLFKSIAERTSAIVFLATPHRGSDLAPVLSKVLSLSQGPRPFVNDLHRNSLATQSTNEEFAQYSQALQLFSFYETLATNFGLAKSVIVEKDSATLGLYNERTALLNANHRNVCKFSSQDNSNYQTIKNILASLMDAVRSHVESCEKDLDMAQWRLLDSCLGVFDSSEDDLMSVDSLRLTGSCEWLTMKKSFQHWRDHGDSQLYWISAKPATGKTVLSGKIISHLKDLKRHCAFYFFSRGDKVKSSIGPCLLSIAWQMACTSVDIQDFLVDLCQKESQISSLDYPSVWRKIFLDGIFKIEPGRRYYWVVDALDECRHATALVALLIKASEISSIKILLTCRDRYEQYRPVGLRRDPVISDEIAATDTRSDISLYLEANISRIPATKQDDRQRMANTILEKSAGCFLWVTLILQELRHVHTSREIRNVLETIPSDMNELYAHILDRMSQQLYGKELAKAILTWTLCSARPLTIDELFHALQIDLNDTIDSIKRSIESSCGQLVYIDTTSKVHMIHATARDFLLSGMALSEFAVESASGHRQLAMACLEYLGGKQMKGPRHRKLSATNVVPEPSPFLDYAGKSLFHHISHVSPDDEKFCINAYQISEFLKCLILD